MMPRIIVLVLLALTGLDTSCQTPVMLRQTTAAGGGWRTATLGPMTVHVQQSVGQGGVIGTRRTSGLALRQGFLQPPGAGGRVSRTEALVVSAFPNPTHGELHLRFAEVPDGPVTLELFDLSGRSLWRSLSSPTPELVLELPYLAAAPYLLRVRAKGSVASLHLQYLPLP